MGQGWCVGGLQHQQAKAGLWSDLTLSLFLYSRQAKSGLYIFINGWRIKKNFMADT